MTAPCHPRPGGSALSCVGRLRGGEGDQGKAASGKGACGAQGTWVAWPPAGLRGGYGRPRCVRTGSRRGPSWLWRQGPRPTMPPWLAEGPRLLPAPGLPGPRV